MPTTRPAADQQDGTFTAEERAAMKERAQEVRTQRRGRAKVDPEAELLAKIAEMADEDRTVAEQVHALVREAAPGLEPRTWYGMPAYARDGKVVCFFQPAGKFTARNATHGFTEDALLDDGAMWPTAFALTRITDVEAARFRELVARAAGS